MMDNLQLITLAHLGGVKMVNATTLKAAIGVALGIMAYQMFLKPNVPFL